MKAVRASTHNLRVPSLKLFKKKGLGVARTVVGLLLDTFLTTTCSFSFSLFHFNFISQSWYRTTGDINIDYRRFGMPFKKSFTSSIYYLLLAWSKFVRDALLCWRCFFFSFLFFFLIVSYCFSFPLRQTAVS